MSQIGRSPSRLYRPGHKPPPCVILDVDYDEAELQNISRMLERKARCGDAFEMLDLRPGDFE